MTELKKNLKPLKDKNAQLVTRYIKHLAESANFKGGTFIKLCNRLIGNRFEMPNVSYTHPLAFSKKKTTNYRQWIKKKN